MFNVGPLELLAIGLVALVVLGPQRLPEAARKAGKVMHDLREMSAGFQREVQQAFEEHGGPQAVQAADTLRSMTGGPLGPVRTGINAAVAAVSSQATSTAAAPAGTTKKAPARKAVAKKAPPRKPAAKKAPPRKPAAKKAPAAAKKTAPPRKAPAKKAAPVKKSAPAKAAAPRKAAVPKAPRPRTTP